MDGKIWRILLCFHPPHLTERFPIRFIVRVAISSDWDVSLPMAMCMFMEPQAIKVGGMLLRSVIQRMISYVIDSTGMERHG